MRSGPIDPPMQARFRALGSPPPSQPFLHAGVSVFSRKGDVQARPSNPLAIARRGEEGLIPACGSPTPSR